LIPNHAVLVLRSAAFSRVCKKRHKNLKAKVDAAVDIIMKSSELDEPKCGAPSRSETVTKNKKAPSCEWSFLFYLVGRAGLEPATNGLKVRCSTN
jgi:hypothetical protein